MRIIKKIIKWVVYWIALVVPDVIVHGVTDLCWAIFNAYQRGLMSIRPYIHWLLCSVLLASLKTPIMANVILLMLGVVKIQLCEVIAHRQKMVEKLVSNGNEAVDNRDLPLIAKTIKRLCDPYFRSTFEWVKLAPVGLQTVIEEILAEYTPSTLLATDEWIPTGRNVT